MKKQTTTIKYLCLMISAGALAFVMSVTASLAWFSLWRDIAAYAPISSPESLFIGAGHCDIDIDEIEYVNYLYFDAMEGVLETHGTPKDESDDTYYWDRVFCIYGKMVHYYKIQLAFTTNNQFTYEIFNATEYTSEQYGYITAAVTEINKTATPKISFESTPHTINYGDRATYYYSLNSVNKNVLTEGLALRDATAEDAAADGRDLPYKVPTNDLKTAVSGKVTSTVKAGTYLNKAEVSEILADSSRHDVTYGSYDKESKTYINPYDHVNKYAEPIYWQTTSAEEGDAKGSFVNYYILRVHSSDTNLNNRETDIICISATTVATT